jgi:hypothetical protein
MFRRDFPSSALMRMANSICFALLLLLARVPAWAQQTAQQDDKTSVSPAAASLQTSSSTSSSMSNANNNNAVSNINTDLPPMVTPPIVSGQSYPVATASQERSNYLRGGVTFATAYSDNILGAVGPNSVPVSDVSYSVWPTIALDQTTTRLHWTLDYAPGFTFYQHTSSRNESDQNAAVNFQYRVSPHVTFSVVDTFQKSSNVFNQPDLGSAGAVSGGAQSANLSVIAPVADRLSNNGNVGMTYQFAANAMIGAGGSFSNLHYPDQSEVPGLFDSESQGGSGFYSYRVAPGNYLGATYQYQRLLAFPTEGENETQTHAVLFFYTYNRTPAFTVSLFGGPQYSNTVQTETSSGTAQSSPVAPLRAWSPAGGASANWQGRLTSFALGYTHIVAGSGGLAGAVKIDSASVSLRQQITRMLSGSVSGFYAQNDVLDAAALGSSNGHSISATASLQQQVGQNLNVQAGYTRLHQDYSTVEVLAAHPDTNREFIAISYQFSKALGR